jgi:hypothetical protein
VLIRHGVQGSLRWCWTTSGKYSASSAYNAMFIGQTGVLGAKELWKVKAPNKCRFFLCGLCCTKCPWTLERLCRHGLRDDVLCAFCVQDSETIGHLMAGCSFAWEVWLRMLHRCCWQNFAPGAEVSFIPWWLSSMKRVPKRRRPMFHSVMVLVAWNL